MKFGDINIDFLILTENKDLRTLSIFDNSYWQHLESKTTVIDIKVPNSTQYVRNYFTKNAINNFNSVNLNINCQTNNCKGVELINLPDGVYDIKLITDGNFVEERQYFRTTKLENIFDEVIRNKADDCDTDCLDEDLLCFLFYIKSIEAYVRNCEIKKAQKFYEMAQKIVNRYECQHKH